LFALRTTAPGLLRAKGLQNDERRDNSISESIPNASNATLPAAAAIAIPASTVIHDT
jgi:hypothetical protein